MRGPAAYGSGESLLGAEVLHAAASNLGVLDTLDVKSRVIAFTTSRTFCSALSGSSRATRSVLVQVTQPWRSELILALW